MFLVHVGTQNVEDMSSTMMVIGIPPIDIGVRLPADELKLSPVEHSSLRHCTCGVPGHVVSFEFRLRRAVWTRAGAPPLLVYSTTSRGVPTTDNPLFYTG